MIVGTLGQTTPKEGLWHFVLGGGGGVAILLFEVLGIYCF
jgi:hypothetical protein